MSTSVDNPLPAGFDPAAGGRMGVEIASNSGRGPGTPIRWGCGDDLHSYLGPDPIGPGDRGSRPSALWIFWDVHRPPRGRGHGPVGGVSDDKDSL